jgi:hypothetical protein
MMNGRDVMTRSILLVAVTLVSGSAFADANCPKYPKSEWMPEGEAKAKLEAEGYKIKKFKVDGNCYEIYGTNKDGKKVEIYFDAKTLAVVKAEIEK